MEELKKKLQEEIAVLENELRVELPREILKARAHGDLSENAEYHAAKERQGWIEGRIAEIEDKMARAQVIDVSKLSGTHQSAVTAAASAGFSAIGDGRRPSR